MKPTENIYFPEVEEPTLCDACHGQLVIPDMSGTSIIDCPLCGQDEFFTTEELQQIAEADAINRFNNQQLAHDIITTIKDGIYFNEQQTDAAF
jgi:hypothetical protein